MGLLKDAYWLRMYLNAKAKSNLIDAIEGENEVTSKGRKKRSSKVVSSNNTESHHLGFWDFLDKRIQEEKKEEQENPTSVKDVLKYIGILLLISLGAYLLLKLVDLFEHWWGTVVTAL